MRGFLIRLSGAEPDLLGRFPSERGKFTGLGGAILFTSGLATLSMWFALYSAVGVNPVLAALFAILWGLAILSLDRWLVVSLPAKGGRRLGLGIPRIVMAVLLGAVVSTPLVLQIFKAEIDAQVVEIKQRRANEFSVAQSQGAVGQQVARWRTEVERHRQTINTNGDVPADPASDAKIQELTKERDAQQKEADKHYKEWQCQLYGGPSCPRKGPGVLAEESKRALDAARGRVTTLERRIQDRRDELTATDEASRSLRVEQARQELPKAQAQLDAATQRADDLQRRFDAENRAQGGLLIRLEALNEASGGDATLAAARILLFLVFLLIECLPVSVKLMHRPGRYEDLVEVAQAKAFRAARDDISRPSAAVPETHRPQPPQDDLADIWRRQPPHQQQAGRGAEDVWRGSEPEGPPRPTAQEAPHAAEPPDDVWASGDTTDHRTPDDAALRRMNDTRTLHEPPKRSGGIELYTEDDDDF